jgi:hypothetical protein
MPNPHLTTADLVVLVLTLPLGLVSGLVSLWGVKSNGALVILPPALLGMLATVVLELLALCLLAFSGLPPD